MCLELCNVDEGMDILLSDGKRGGHLSEIFCIEWWVLRVVSVG